MEGNLKVYYLQTLLSPRCKPYHLAMSSAVETSLILEMPARAQKMIQRFLDFARNDKNRTVPSLPKFD